MTTRRNLFTILAAAFTAGKVNGKLPSHFEEGTLVPVEPVPMDEWWRDYRVC